jgi:hypothetical protein
LGAGQNKGAPHRAYRHPAALISGVLLTVVGIVGSRIFWR